MSTTPSIPVLLRSAIAQPIIIRDGDYVLYADAVHEWSRMLCQQFPLWALRPEAYARLNGPPVPLTYPLPRFVESICRDERLTRASAAPGIVEGIDALIDRRRCRLVAGESFPWDDAELSESEVRLSASFGSITFPQVLEGPILATYEPDTEYSTGGYISPYEEIGLELVELLERREAARSGSAERAAARNELTSFLARIARSAPGHPTSITRAVARKLVEEGCTLLRPVWEALENEVEFSADVARVLVALGAPIADLELWALRLVLPIFSIVELEALKNAIRRAPQAASNLQPAREFCVNLIAHRLALSVTTVARKVTHGWAAEILATGDGCTVCGILH